MSKIRFDLRKLPVPSSIRIAGRLLQTIDTVIHESAAKLVSMEFFARGREQGYSLLLNDQEEEVARRVAFAQAYNSDRIVVYYAPTANTGEFMRQITAFKNNEPSPVRTEIFNPTELDKAANFICEYFDEL